MRFRLTLALAAIAAAIVVPISATSQDAEIDRAPPAAEPDQPGARAPAVDEQDQPRPAPRAPRPSTAPAPAPKRALPATPPAAQQRPSAPPPAAAASVAAPSAPPSPASTPAAATVQRVARLAPGEPLPPEELQAYVDGVVKSAMDQDHIAGVAVSVVQNGQVVLKKGYGFADLAPARPVDPDRTLFRIGSISKTFTWIALMNEVEAGRIRIDAPVNLYLPERLQIRDQGYSTPVRVSNLLDHSAGFEDRALGHLFERRFERVRPLAVYLRQERPRRVREPGAVASYSNYGVALAGQALVYVTGRPFEDLIEARITEPLGMTRTTFREPHPPKQGFPAPMAPALARDLSEGYRWTPAGFAPRPFEFVGHIAPAGSASSTAADMARYMQVLLNQGVFGETRIYGPGAARAFATPMRPTASGISGWRHGFIEYPLPGGATGFGHAGATLSFISNMVVVPELGLGVFVTTNTETGGELARDLPAQVVQQFYAAPQVFPRPPAPELARQAGVYEGHYLSTRRAYGGLEGFVGRLRGGVQVGVTPEGRLVTNGLDGARTWVPDEGAGVFVETLGEERIAFRLQDGEAVSFQPALGAAEFERTGPLRHPSTLAVLAVLTALASAATLGGVLVRNRRENRETSIQSRASQLQTAQATLWLIAMVLFGVWAAQTGDVAEVVYGWPGPWLVLASACAFVAALLTALSLVLLPAVWRGGRRVDSWSPLRKASFSFTVLLFVAFAVVLALWGALSPWSG